jgi:hypothetical protein
VVQDLVIRPHVVNFRCERWQTADGETTTAALPAGINGHFGPELRRFVLAQYHQGQVTVPRLLALLRALGIVISKRRIGNAHFAWFGTTGSKSRSNFLELLRAGHGDYVINAEALAYMRQRVSA